MSAFDPKRTSVFAPHRSAFGGKADMTFCGYIRKFLRYLLSSNIGFGVLLAGVIGLTVADSGGVVHPLLATLN
jgi:hypothetical protein